MRTNRVFFLSDGSDFASALRLKLISKYDVDTFTEISDLEEGLKELTPVALISTVNTDANLKLMKKHREVLFKSQYFNDYTIENASKYGLYCVCTAGRDWVDEILNASCQIIDDSIIRENVTTAVRKNTDVLKPDNKVYSKAYKTVRTKTKESARMPARKDLAMLNNIVEGA